MADDRMNSVADFLFEAGMLAKTPRTGFNFLGSGKQSVAEHLNRTVYIGFALAEIAGDVDTSEVIKMCMFHDFTEARISDLNYVHQKYNRRHEHKALYDLIKHLPFGDKIAALMREYEERESREALLAKDADNLEFILSLKEQKDVGNVRTDDWIPPAVKRLKTPEAKRLVEAILSTDSDHWWFGDKKDKYWIDRNK